jgi:hypothetical protein
MTEPSLSFIIATIDPERPLRRCLLSLAKQPLAPQDEVIVVIDGAGGWKPEIELTVRSFGPQYHFIYLDTGHHCWGHCQIWWAAMYVAEGDYINVNDDDDIWAQGAVARMRAEIKALTEPMPLMFRGDGKPFMPAPEWDEAVFNAHPWEIPLNGHLIVFPNVKSRIPKFGCRNTADRQWVIDIGKAWGGKVKWVDFVAQHWRPTPKNWPERWTE